MPAPSRPEVAATDAAPRGGSAAGSELRDDVGRASAPSGAGGGRFSAGAVAVLATIALVAAWTAWFVDRYAPLVPLGDGWTWVAHAKAWSERGFAGFWAEDPLLHAQHVYLLPSSLALALGPLFDGSFRPFAFLGAALTLACGVALYRVSRADGAGRALALVVFAAAVTFRHVENLLFGFQFGLPMSVLFAIAAIAAVGSRPGTRGLVAALALATGSAACSSAGLFAFVAVLLVRARPRRVTKATIGVWLVAFVALLVVAHVLLSVLFERSFVADAWERLSLARAPRILADFARLAGGGIVGGDAATPVGLAIVTLALTRLIVDVRERARASAVGGLAFFGLASTFAIAIARTPIDTPESRHAIFAAPAVAAAVLELARWFAAWSSVRARTALATGATVVLAWLHADAYAGALAVHRQAIAWDVDTRLALGAIAGGPALTDAELRAVNTGDPERVRGLLTFTRAAQRSIFGPSYHGLDVRTELPQQLAPGARAAIEDGVLAIRGPGHVFERVRCTFASGGIARLAIDAETGGGGNFGFLVRGADGVEKQNAAAPLEPGTGSRVRSVRVRIDAGDELDAYVFAASASEPVRLRSFSLVLVQSSCGP